MKIKWPMPPTLLCMAVAAMVALHALGPVMRLIPWPWRWAGVLPLIAGVIWNIWADQLFKRHQTTVKPHLAPTSMVSSGPFAISRNPMYLGMIAITTGTAALLGSLTPMIVPVVFAAILAVKFVPMEERSMERTFGDVWRQYRQCVRRWL